MAEPMTEDEIAAFSRKTQYPIEAARKAAHQLDRIERLLREHPDLTREDVVFGIMLQSALRYQ